MLRKVAKFFAQSNRKFLRTQTDLILSGVSERCLCGSLMTCLRYILDDTEFAEYHSDIEYNRNYNGSIKTIFRGNHEVINVTCDLIVHSRGEKPAQDNLLAIEMKRIEHDEDEKTKDRNRLIALTKPTYDENLYSYDGVTLPEHVCGYVLGVFYEIDKNNRRILLEYYVGGELRKEKTVNF